jgi:formate-dependent nitrite reductase membrane component NrfD
VSHLRRKHPPEEAVLEEQRGRIDGRDVTPAVGTRGQPGPYRRAVEGAKVALARPRWGDARWSYLFGPDTRYRSSAADAEVAASARAVRGQEDLDVHVQGPMMKPAVWTWEVPLYFWLGGIAAGSSLIGLACDVAEDHASAQVARKVALGAVMPGAPLLILDLGRPERFFKMLRIFKPRSPMSMGAWCLMGFSTFTGAAVAADLTGREKPARALGALMALFGTYLGSYTGALLAATAVPVWGRSRLFLGPIFVCTATATGAAANRLVLVATGTPAGHPTRNALGVIETAAMSGELVLSTINEKRLGRLARSLEAGRPGTLFQAAKWMVRAGLALHVGRRRGGPWVHHLASVLYLLAGLCFRFAWVGAGRTSAHDDEAVARMARLRGRKAA